MLPIRMDQIEITFVSNIVGHLTATKVNGSGMYVQVSFIAYHSILCRSKHGKVHLQSKVICMHYPTVMIRDRSL